MGSGTNICHEVLKSIRKIIRAIDLNSKKILRKYDLTGPQLLILKDLSDHGSCPVGSLAKRVSLSHATVTEIIDRLEKKGHVKRVKSEKDKRKVFVVLEEKANKVLEQNPTLLQEKFMEEFTKLPDWEQSQILCNFQRVAFFMDAEDVDASPMLVNTSIIAGDNFD
ncbi:MAG: MarR family transcriptional regulator [Waddliaceae bacterium]